MRYKEFYISITDDCEENKGGKFCQVYTDEHFDNEVDNFCLHREELENHTEEELIKDYMERSFYVGKNDTATSN